MFTKKSRLYQSLRPSVDQAATACDVVRAAQARSRRELLTEQGAAFLAHIAVQVSLAHTADAYPQVINRLAVYGNKPRLLAKAIDRLLVHDLPGRRGFPPEITFELGRLREMCADFERVTDADIALIA